MLDLLVYVITPTAHGIRAPMRAASLPPAICLDALSAILFTAPLRSRYLTR